MSVTTLPPFLVPAGPPLRGIQVMFFVMAGVANASDPITTPARDTTGANLLIAVTCNNISNPTAVFTDSAANVWANTPRYGSGGGGAVQVWYCYNPITSATHTVNIAATSSNLASVFFMACTGSAPSPLDQQTGAASSTTGNITTTTNGEFIIAACTDTTTTGQGVVATNALPYVNAAQVGVIGGNRFAHGVSYMQQRLAGVVSAPFSAGGGAPGSVIASFRSLAG